jgi:hypothetical protein
VLPAGASANVWLAGSQAIVEAAQPEQTVPSAPLPATPWGTPVLVSPRNGTALFHYPRTTTLIWQPVLTATAYVVEAAYLSGSTWTAYPPVTVTGNSNAFYTFAFVGDQKGRWRVTAFNGTVYSSPSAWWTFSYNTTPQMATPIQTNPANNEIFGHYPRALTLSWKMVPAAAGYNLEIAYCDSTRTTCVSYPIVTITIHYSPITALNLLARSQASGASPRLRGPAIVIRLRVPGIGLRSRSDLRLSRAVER